MDFHASDFPIKDSLGVFQTKTEAVWKPTELISYTYFWIIPPQHITVIETSNSGTEGGYQDTYCGCDSSDKGSNFSAWYPRTHPLIPHP